MLKANSRRYESGYEIDDNFFATGTDIMFSYYNIHWPGIVFQDHGAPALEC